MTFRGFGLGDVGLCGIDVGVLVAFGLGVFCTCLLVCPGMVWWVISGLLAILVG